MNQWPVEQWPMEQPTVVTVDRWSFYIHEWSSRWASLYHKICTPISGELQVCRALTTYRHS